MTYQGYPSRIYIVIGAVVLYFVSISQVLQVLLELISVREGAFCLSEFDDFL